MHSNYKTLKKIVLLSLLSLSTLYSCKKEKPQKMDFSISGQKDTTFDYQKIVQKLSVKFNSGEKSKVNLTISGLPKGLDALLTNASGTPDFETNLELSNNDYLTAGNYPIKINGTAEDGTMKSENFSIKITKTCGDFAAGTYKTDVTYSLSGELLNTAFYTISTKPDNPNRLYFFDGKNLNPDFFADFNCDSSTIVVPVQNKNGSTLKISGNGKMTNKTRQLELTVVYEDFTTLKFSMVKQ